MQELRRLTVPELRRVVMSRAFKMEDDLFGVIDQLVKIAGRGEYRLQHHAQRQQAQKDCSEPCPVPADPNHRGILASKGRLYNSTGQN